MKIKFLVKSRVTEPSPTQSLIGQPTDLPANDPLHAAEPEDQTESLPPTEPSPTQSLIGQPTDLPANDPLHVAEPADQTEPLPPTEPSKVKVKVKVKC